MPPPLPDDDFDIFIVGDSKKGDEALTEPVVAEPAEQVANVSLKEIDSFYEDISSVDDLETKEEPDYEDLSTFKNESSPQKPEPETEVEQDSTHQTETGITRKQLLATAVASNVLGIAIGFGGNSLLSPSASQVSGRAAPLPAVAALPLTDNEVRSEVFQTDEQTPLPLPDVPSFPETPPPAILPRETVSAEESAPFEESTTETSEPKKESNLAALPPQKMGAETTAASNKKQGLDTNSAQPPPSKVTELRKLSEPPQETQETSRETPVADDTIAVKYPRFMVQIASCVSKDCVEDYQLLLKRVRPESQVRVVPFTVSRPITEVRSRETFGEEQTARLIRQINQTGSATRAFRVNENEGFRISLGQFPKVEQAARVAVQINGEMRGVVFFEPRATEQKLQYYRVQVAGSNQRLEAQELQEWLRSSDARLSNAFVVPYSP